MARWRCELEETFEALARWTCRRARWVIAACALLVAALGAQAVRIEVDTSPEAMLHADDPVRRSYDAFRDEFGSDQVIVVGVGAPERFHDAFLARLRALHRDLEARVPLVRRVDSLVNVRFTRGEEDEFRVGELLADWEARGGDAAALQAFAVHHPLYRDNLISSDGRLVALTIETEAVLGDPEVATSDALAGFAELDGDVDGNGGGTGATARRYLSSRERAEVVDAVRAVLAEHRADDLPLYLSGTPVVVDAFDRATMADVTLCASASAVAILLILVWFFRRVSGVLLPNLVVVAALASTFGLMGLLGAPFTLTTNTLIPVLITVGVCSSIHLLAIFYRHFPNGVEKGDAIAHAVGHAGPAIVMTSLTTAAGFLSFALADLSATAEMGRYAAIGVLFCLLYTLFLLPAALAVTPIRRHVRNPATSATADRFLLWVANASLRHPRAILLASLAIAAIAFGGIGLVRFSHDPISYFAADAAVRTDLATIDRELRGGTTLEVVIDSGAENGLYEPALLRAVDALGYALPKATGHLLAVSRVFSLNDIVKETHQALHGNDPSRYAIPPDRATLSQELFLFENSGSADLGRMVDATYRQARLTIKTPYSDGVVYRDFVAEVERHFEGELGAVAAVDLTGGMALEAQAVPKALESMRESYVLAFLGISVLMIVFLGSLRIGLVAMIPNLLPIAAALGLMGWLDVPLDMTTITIGSIGLGLVVDDTIHFFYNFQKYHERTGDLRRAVEATFLGTGRAMMVTSLVLVGTFWVDVLASLANVVRFGLFIGLIVIFALLADLLVAPALMRVLHRRRAGWPGLAAPLGRPSGILVLALALLAPPLVARADVAREIMQRVHDRDDGEQARMEIEMTLTDAAGRTRERRAELRRRDRGGGTDSILFFLEPADVRGTGFLTHDHDDPAATDDQWLYLPALGRTKRISSKDKSRPFMGSDFSYADMTRRSVEHYDYTLAGEADVRGHACWQIEAIPRSEHEAEETGYRRSVLFVRKDIDVVVRAVHWLRDSDRLKYFDVRRIEPIDGIWTPLEIHMTTRRGREREHRTVLRNRNVRYDEGIPAHDFTEQRLARGP
jgi:uncharacterized protein